MARPVLALWLLAWAASAGHAPHGPAHGPHPGAPQPPAPPAPRGEPPDHQAAADYRVDDAAYIGDLDDVDYQVDPKLERGDEYEEEEEEGKSVPDTTWSAPTTQQGALRPHPAATRSPWRYRNGTLYDDYFAPCAGLVGGAGRLRAHPLFPLPTSIAALAAALARTR